jgi:hypothetical protein
MKLVVEKKKPGAASTDGKSAEAYTCPMHFEIRTSAPGKCPKCEMALVPTALGITDDFDLKMESEPKAPRPNEKVRLRFSVYNPKSGEKVRQFAIMHEKLYHLFVVSQDLDEFQHIHPDIEQDGSFVIDTVLPRPGHYKVFSDFYPIEGIPQVIQRDLVTAGYTQDLFASQARISPDSVLERTVDGMKIQLMLEPQEIIAGKPATLRYILTDARTGQPVHDLKPYLGALGHTLILSEDLSDYVHSHPEDAQTEADRKKTGPEVSFEALLPRPGNYRVWTQFLRGETLTTVSFNIKAVRMH